MPTYEICVESRFEAAHHLTSYRGAPEPVHGHSWRVEVHLICSELTDEGFGVDFVEIKQALDQLVAAFDHGDINSVPPFDEISPTAEHLARWIYDEMSRKLNRPIDGVNVQEAPGCSVMYRP